MANETMIANMTFQTGTTAANTFIKISDLLQILLKEQMNDEIAKWVADGHATCKEPIIADNKELAKEFEISLRNSNIPYMRLIYDKTGQRIEPLELAGKMDLAAMSDSELAEMGDFEVAYVVKDIDEERAYACLMELERQKIIDNEKYELKPEELNRHFGSVDTNDISGLSLTEAKVLRKELSAQKIHTALIRDELTKTYSLKLANVDMQPRNATGNMTPVEYAMSKAIFKLAVPEIKEYEALKTENDKSLNAVKKEALQHAWGKDTPLPEKVIYDSAHPDTCVEFTVNNTAVLYKDGIRTSEFSLKNRPDVAALDKELNEFICPQVLNENVYNKLKKESPDKLQLAYEKLNYYRDIENNIDDVSDELIDKRFMEVRLNEHEQDNPLAPFSFGAKEVRLENTSEVREIVAKLKPESMAMEKINGGEIDYGLFKDSLDKLVENSAELMSKLNITPTSPYAPIATRLVPLDFDSQYQYVNGDPSMVLDPAVTDVQMYYAPIETTSNVDLSNTDVVDTKDGIMFVDRDNPDRVVLSFDRESVDAAIEAAEQEPNYDEAATMLDLMRQSDEAEEDLNNFFADTGEDIDNSFEDMEPELGADWGE